MTGGGATLKDSWIGSPGSPAGGGEIGGVCVTGQRGPRCQMGGGENVRSTKRVPSNPVVGAC